MSGGSGVGLPVESACFGGGLQRRGEGCRVDAWGEAHGEVRALEPFVEQAGLGAVTDRSTDFVKPLRLPGFEGCHGPGIASSFTRTTPSLE